LDYTRGKPNPPIACYATAATRLSKDPDTLIYLGDKWYTLRGDSQGKPYLGTRRPDIEEQIAEETPARKSVEERPASPDSIFEPEKRQTAPIPSKSKWEQAPK
jgi:hypothetical protein